MEKIHIFLFRVTYNHCKFNKMCNLTQKFTKIKPIHVKIVAVIIRSN